MPLGEAQAAELKALLRVTITNTVFTASLLSFTAQHAAATAMALAGLTHREVGLCGIAGSLGRRHGSERQQSLYVR